MKNNNIDWLNEENWSHQAQDALLSKELDCFVIAGTGHRPPRLGLNYSISDNKKLFNFVKTHLEKIKPDLVISGGAQGFDQALAASAFILKIPYWVAIPFKGQESKWPTDARDRYQRMINYASRIIEVCPGLYDSRKFLARDNFMMNCAKNARKGMVLTIFDGGHGQNSGTAHTLKYANILGLESINLWNYWRDVV